MQAKSIRMYRRFITQNDKIIDLASILPIHAANEEKLVEVEEEKNHCHDTLKFQYFDEDRHHR